MACAVNSTLYENEDFKNFTAGERKGREKRRALRHKGRARCARYGSWWSGATPSDARDAPKGRFYPWESSPVQTPLDLDMEGSGVSNPVLRDQGVVKVRAFLVEAFPFRVP